MHLKLIHLGFVVALLSMGSALSAQQNRARLCFSWDPCGRAPTPEERAAAEREQQEAREREAAKQRWLNRLGQQRAADAARLAGMERQAVHAHQAQPNPPRRQPRDRRGGVPVIPR